MEYVHTFKIEPVEDEWSLTVNNVRFIGTYSSLSEAMGALAGLLSDSATSDDWLNQYIQGSVEQDNEYSFAGPVGVRARFADLPTGTRTGYRRIASNVGMIHHLYSFDINEHNEEWVLKINKTHLIGVYPTMDAAMEVLTGVLSRFRADTDWIDQWIISSLESGRSHVDVPEGV